MSQKTTPVPQPNSQDKILRWIITRIQLVLRLMFDGRVKLFLKLFPILGIFLLFTPLLGGFLARIGAFLVAMVLFVEASPPKVIREHLEDMYRPLGEKKKGDPLDEEIIIDAEFRDVSEDDKTSKN